MKPHRWMPVEVKGRRVHFPFRDPDKSKLLYHYKTPEEEAWWNANPLEFKTACGATSVYTLEPIVSPFIRLPPQEPPPDLSGRILTMRAVARYLGLPSAREAVKFLRRNSLKPVRAGRRFFVQKATVDEFIIGQEKTPTSVAVYTRAAEGADLAAVAGRALDVHAPRRGSHAPA